MREIKFRAWSPISKAFVYGFLGQWFFDATPNSEGLDGTEDGTDLAVLNLQPWQQFTGLHDKNGKEIYEGDVVRQAGKTNVSNKKIVSYRVTPKHGTGFNISGTSSQQSSCEIVGNIYETPELAA